MKLRLIVLLPVVYVFSVSAQAASQEARANSLVSTFRKLCLAQAPSFAAMEKQANAAHLKVKEDLLSPTDEHGYYLHSKSWYMPLADGTAEWGVGEGLSPKGYVQTCGLGAKDADGNAFRKQLIQATNINKPTKEVLSPRGGEQRISAWDFGSGRTLMLTDGTPKGHSGIYVLYMQIVPKK